MRTIATARLLLLSIHCSRIFAFWRARSAFFGSKLQHRGVKIPFVSFSSNDDREEIVVASRRRQQDISENDAHQEIRITSLLLSVRGGDQEVSLDEKVHAAMQKLGLKPPPPSPPTSSSSSSTASAGGSTNKLDEKQPGSENSAPVECEGGICSTMPPPPPPPTTSGTAQFEAVENYNSNLPPPPPPPTPLQEEVETPTDQSSSSLVSEGQVGEAATSLAEEMKVDYSLALAAMSATSTPAAEGHGRTFHIEAARSMIQQELDMIDQIPADSDQVQSLVAEGFDLFLCRRALAFAEGDMDDARAILLADKEDEEHDRQQQQQQQEQQRSEEDDQYLEQDGNEVFPTVTIDSNIDPTSLPSSTDKNADENKMPKPAAKDDVVFEATSEQIQELVLESPVPVLLDVYADWCGPCKVLTPALEDMAQKSGGLFRLVKVNTDKEKSISTDLEVTALPTVFGIKGGKIIHMFQGMPRSENGMKSFMQGLIVHESSFDPPLTNEQKAKYQSLTTKLVKVAGTASFPFSARERLKDRVQSLLDNLVVQTDNDASKAAESAKIVKSLLTNIIQNPTKVKFRTAKLSNSVLATKVAPFSAAVGLLKSAGFRQTKDGENSGTLSLGGDKAFVNVAPLVVVRDLIDSWIDHTRREVVKAARKREEEAELARIHEEGLLDNKSEEDDDEMDTDDADKLNTCLLKVRFAGKKKVYEISLAATDRLSNMLDQLPGMGGDQDSEVQITCVAKRLVVKSTDKSIMEEKTLQELGLTPTAALVVAVKNDSDQDTSEQDRPRSKLSERSKKRKKQGSHTMQSVGIYSKDDNAKAELIDGGGGVWYEHDVSDDDDEEEKTEKNETDDGDDEGADEADEQSPEETDNDA
ncbi:hypothetical protein ACA910_017735 [Epithemia clementina (nom. ined.)]